MQMIFERYEKKYWLTKAQYQMLLPKLQGHMKEDEYSYGTVCSIYYDNDSYDMIRRSIEKPRYKEKLRVRSYGIPGENNRIFVEIKKKFNRKVYKRRVALLPGQLKGFLEEKEKLSDEPQIQNEILFLIRQYQPKPQIFIGYDRYALYGTDDPDLRITFDTNIRWRTDNLDLQESDRGEPLLPGDDRILMEVKTGKGMSLWLTGLLADLEILPGSFSKVGTCYLKYIATR